MNHTVQANFVLVLVDEEFIRQGDGADLHGHGSDTTVPNYKKDMEKILFQLHK